MPRGVYKRVKRKRKPQGPYGSNPPASGAHAHAGAQASVPRHIYLNARRLKTAVLKRMAEGGEFEDVELFALLLVRELTGEK